MEVSEHQTERTPGNQKKCSQCRVAFGAVLSALCRLLKQVVKGRSAESIETLEPPSVETLARVMRKIELIELVGRGGMGAVYKARQSVYRGPQLVVDRIVAVKVLLAQPDDDGSIYSPF